MHHLDISLKDFNLEKIAANDMTGEELIAKIYKPFLQLNIKKQTN